MRKQIHHDPLVDGFYSEFYERERLKQDAFLMLRRGVIRHQATGQLLPAAELEQISSCEAQLVLSAPELWLLEASRQSLRQDLRRRRTAALRGAAVISLSVVLILKLWTSPPEYPAAVAPSVAGQGRAGFPAPAEDNRPSESAAFLETVPWPAENEKPTGQENQASPPETKEAAGYEEKVALGSKYYKVKQNGKWGVLNPQGKMVLAAEYDQISRFRPGKLLFLIERNGRRGIADSKGEILLHPFFDQIEHYFPQAGLFIVTQGKRQGIYSQSERQFTLGMDYPAICCFSEGLIGVQVEEGRWGFADLRGRLIIPASFDEIIEPFQRGRALVRQDDQEMVIDLAGSILTAAR